MEAIHTSPVFFCLHEAPLYPAPLPATKGGRRDEQVRCQLSSRNYNCRYKATSLLLPLLLPSLALTSVAPQKIVSHDPQLESAHF